MFANKNDNARLASVYNDACSTANNAGRKMRAFIDTATHEAHDATITVEKQIRRHPVQSTVIAAGIGFLLGVLFRRH